MTDNPNGIINTDLRLRVGDTELIARMAWHLFRNPAIGVLGLQEALRADGIAASLARVQRLSGIPSRGQMHATFAALVLWRLEHSSADDDELQAIVKRHRLDRY